MSQHPDGTSGAGPVAPGRPPGPAGVIHDIGYRRYDGPRLGRPYAVRTLFLDSLRSAYGLGRTAKSKVLPFLLLAVMAVPAAVMVAVTIVIGLTELPVHYTAYAMVLPPIVGLYVAAQAPQLFSRDLRYRTITLYLSRPFERLDYVVAKSAALAAAIAILQLLPLLVLYGGALLAELPLRRETEGFLQGLAVAIVLSLVLTGLGGLLAAVTTRRGLGVAAIIGLLSVSYGAVNAVAGFAASEGNDTAATYAGLFSPFTLVDGLQAWVFGAGGPSSAVPAPEGALAGGLYVLTTVVVLAGSFGLLVLRYLKAART